MNFGLARPEHVNAVLGALDETPRTAHELAAVAGIDFRQVLKVLYTLGSRAVTKSYRKSEFDSTRTVMLWKKSTSG